MKGLHVKKSAFTMLTAFVALSGLPLAVPAHAAIAQPEGAPSVALRGDAAASAAAAPSGAQKPLEVKGQSRNLNMLLTLRNDKDKIKFVKVRDNYREEILEQTQQGER